MFKYRKKNSNNQNRIDECVLACKLIIVKYLANLEEKGDKLYINIFYFMLAVGAVRNDRFA